MTKIAREHRGKIRTSQRGEAQAALAGQSKARTFKMMLVMVKTRFDVLIP